MWDVKKEELQGGYGRISLFYLNYVGCKGGQEMWWKKEILSFI